VSESPDADVVIAGGGISGLAAAFWLRERGCTVRLFEQADRVGGVMHSERIDGWLLEHGPTALMTSHADIFDLCDRLDLGERAVDANRSARRRYLLKQGRLEPLPLGLVDFIRTPLWSGRAKWRLLAEPFIPPDRAGREESVSQWVTRRIGREFLDYGFDPFVSGVYAGDPERLSMQSTFGRLVAWERQHGSVVRGALSGRRKSGDVPSAPAPRMKRRFFSFQDGVAELPRAIGRRLGSALRLSSRVTRLESSGDGWLVDVDASGTTTRHRARAVMLSTPAGATADLVESLAPQAGHALRAIDYAPIVIVFLGMARADVGHPLDGFGCLVPGREGSNVLGSLWNSTVFPGRAPEGMVALTNYLGGAKRPELARASDDELTALALGELRRWLGVTDAPRVARVVRWPRAIPQYTLGHADRLAAIEQAMQKWPTLTLLGNYLRGVSVPDCIVQAKAAADQLAARLNGGRT